MSFTNRKRPDAGRVPRGLGLLTAALLARSPVTRQTHSVIVQGADLATVRAAVRGRRRRDHPRAGHHPRRSGRG